MKCKPWRVSAYNLVGDLAHSVTIDSPTKFLAMLRYRDEYGNHSFRLKIGLPKKSNSKPRARITSTMDDVRRRYWMNKLDARKDCYVAVGYKDNNIRHDVATVGNIRQYHYEAVADGCVMRDYLPYVEVLNLGPLNNLQISDKLGE